MEIQKAKRTARHKRTRARFATQAGDTIHSTSHEGHEQLVATWCVSSDDCVLEIGGGIGSVSTMLQKILTNKAHHVVVEPQARMCETLVANAKLHGSDYVVCEGALSVGPIYSTKSAALDGPDSANQRQWMFNRTSASPGGCRARVESFSLDRLRSLVSKPFSALVVDCEGAFPTIVRDFPDILDGIRVVYLERDGPPGTDYADADAALEAQGLALVLAASKHRVYLRATPSQLAKRDLAKARKLNNRCDAKTAQSYKRERDAAKTKAKAKRRPTPNPAKRPRVASKRDDAVDAARPSRPTKRQCTNLQQRPFSNESAVGRRVEIFWPLEDAFFPGTVASYDGAKHTVNYDDGDVETVDFRLERVNFLQN